MAPSRQADANGLWSWSRHPNGKQSFIDNPPRSIDEALERKTNMYLRPDGTTRLLRQKNRAKVYSSNGSSYRFEDENYSKRRSNIGSTKHQERTVKTTFDDFQDFGKRNGYTPQQIKETYDNFLSKNRQQKARVPVTAANDHFLPHKSRYYQAGENYRNMGALSPEVNRYKTDKMPTPQEMRAHRIPTSKQELLRMEFNNVEPPDPKAIRNLSSRIARDTTRLKARQNNPRLDAAVLRRNALLQNISKASPMLGKYAAALPSSVLGFAPDLIEIADHYTNDAVSNGINNGINTAVDFVKDNGKKAVNNANGIVKQFIDAYADRLPGNTNGFDFSG